MPDTHVETQIVPGRRLGRRPHDPTRPALQLANYLTGAVPAHPTAVDYASRITDWQMLGNSSWGDCGPAGACHSRMQASLYLGGTQQAITTSDALALYKLVNPTFDPNTGAGDDGVVLADMLSHVLREGVAGTKALGYAQVDASNVDEVRAAIALFGSVIFGVDLDTAQQQQTDSGGPWDYVPSGTWGGHAVLGVAYDSAPTGTDITVVTWGQTLGMTLNFEQKQVAEAWVVLWPEHLGSTEFLAGVDVAALAKDYEALTGKSFPAPLPPAPTPPPAPNPGPTPQPPNPVPGPDAADRTFAKVLKPWAQGWHPWTHKLQQAAKTWLNAKGL